VMGFANYLGNGDLIEGEVYRSNAVVSFAIRERS